MSVNAKRSIDSDAELSDDDARAKGKKVKSATEVHKDTIFPLGKSILCR